MRRFTAASALVLLAATVGGGAHQLDTPCARWVTTVSDVSLPDTQSILFASLRGCIGCDSFGTSSLGSCDTWAEIVPCWNNHSQKFGHRDLVSWTPTDYCRTWVDGTASFDSGTYYVPLRGPEWEKWKWVTVKKGDNIPDHAVQYDGAVLARSKHHGNGVCYGLGFTGWAESSNGVLGNVHFTTANIPDQTLAYDVAVCDTFTTTPPMTTASPPVTTQPPATASPTLPPNNKPYIRFGHTIPTSELIEAVITQGTVSYSWKSYKFGQFSGWTELFAVGPGTIAFYAVESDGSRGALQMQVTTLLTPGPLVVVAKGQWPPTSSLSSWETIAASYVPKPFGESGIRLFNLIPDTKLQLGLNASKSGNLAAGVAYTTGSTWAAVPQSVAQSLTVYNSGTSALLATLPVTPPPHPFVCTVFVVGTNVTGGSYGPRGVVLVDAPEG